MNILNIKSVFDGHINDVNQKEAFATMLAFVCRN